MTQMDLFQAATSSQQDTPASPFHLPATDEAVKMTDISGHTYFPLFKPNDPLGAFSRMFMGMSLWASTRCYLTWKGKATPQGRSLFQLVPLTHLTDETEFGLLHTPTAKANQMAPDMLAKGSGWWPTPRVSGQENLDTLIERKGLQKALQHNLTAAVQMWPTPTAHNSKEGGFPAEYTRNTRTLTAEATQADNKPHSSGSLNPQWVEWLMGYPEGWTDLED